MTETDETTAPQWWIADGQIAAGGKKILGPFATKDLAFEVRRYVEIVNAPATYWVDQDAPEQERKLALIGRDLALVEGLAKQVNRDGLKGHAATDLSKTSDGRGFAFDVQIHHDRKSTGRVAKVTVALDRVEQGED